MIKKMILYAIALFLLFSCQQDGIKHYNTELGACSVRYNSIDEYYKTHSDTVGNNPWMSFYFLNNPYGLNANNIISIYVSGKVVYRGPFDKLVELKGNYNELREGQYSMDFHLEILTDKTKRKIYKRTFSTKTTFSWNEQYKIIYCVFCPTNEEVEKVYFIPQLELML